MAQASSYMAGKTCNLFCSIYFSATSLSHYTTCEIQSFSCFISYRYKDSVANRTWPEVFRAFGTDGLDNILVAIDLLLSFPPTSVANETCFSATKLTKGKRRGRMKISTLNDVMVVQLGSPSVSQFDPASAINKWLVSAVQITWKLLSWNR